MSRTRIVLEALASWFDEDARLPVTDGCILHAFERTIEVESDGYRSVLEAFRSGFPDVHWRVHRVLSDGEWSSVHTDLVGTHSGVWSDLAPTGAVIEWEHMLMFRFDGDSIAEVWEFFDPSQITRQLTADRNG